MVPIDFVKLSHRSRSKWAIWWCPKIGVPPNHPFLVGILHSKPSSYWGLRRPLRQDPIACSGDPSAGRGERCVLLEFATTAAAGRMKHGLGQW